MQRPPAALRARCWGCVGLAGRGEQRGTRVGVVGRYKCGARKRLDATGSGEMERLSPCRSLVPLALAPLPRLRLWRGCLERPRAATLLGEVMTDPHPAASAARSWSCDSSPAGPALCPPCAPFGWAAVTIRPDPGSGSRRGENPALLLSSVTLSSYLTS